MRRLSVLAFALAAALATVASAAVTWQTGPVATGQGQQFLFVTDGSAAAQQFESNVLGDANVATFLANYRCWRLSASQAGTLGLTAPSLVIRDGQGLELWKRDALVAAPELITALVIHAPAPQPAEGTTPQVVTSVTEMATTTTNITTGSAALTQIVSDARGDAANPALDLVSASWGMNGATLTIVITVGGTAQVDGFHLYLDSDGNQGTGFNTTNMLGADRMIEGGTVYNFAGAAQTDWNWQQTGMVNYQSTGPTLTLTMSHETLGVTSGQSLKVSFGFTGSDWAPADWMPDGQPVTVTVP